MHTKYLFDVVQSLVPLLVYGLLIDVCSLKQKKRAVAVDMGKTNDSYENILYVHR